MELGKSMNECPKLDKGTPCAEKLFVQCGRMVKLRGRESMRQFRKFKGVREITVNMFNSVANYT
jgi:hypothetical protein